VIGSETAVSLLVETAGHGLQSDEIRYAAIRSLRAHELENARFALVDALASRSKPLRIAAAAGLAQLGDSRGLDTLIDALFASDVSEVGRETADAGLRALSGEDFGYVKQYGGPTSNEDRTRAREKWLEWARKFKAEGQ
jgi:HEAT repeat protein